MTYKSSMAVARLELALERSNLSVKFVSATQLAERWRARQNDPVAKFEIDQAQKTGILVIDDLSGYSTDAAREGLWAVLSARFDARKPTIITTNAPSHQFLASFPEDKIEQARTRLESFLTLTLSVDEHSYNIEVS